MSPNDTSLKPDEAYKADAPIMERILFYNRPPYDMHICGNHDFSWIFYAAD